MDARKKIEVFISGCPVCEPVVKTVKEISGEKYDIILYNLSESRLEGTGKAKEYGVNYVPSVAVDGRLLNCCKQPGFDKKELEEALQ